MHKICHISTAHSTFDTRIFYKECKTLASAGYETYLIVTSNKKEIIDRVHIIPLPQRKERLYRFFLKDWIALFKAIRLNTQICHFHDPELIWAGLILKLLGKKVIYDVHEDVPKQILNKEWIKNKRLRKFVSLIFDKFEKISVKLFDGIVAATPDIAKNFPQGKTIILENLPILKLIDSTKPVNVKKDKFVIIYAGALTRIRGIKEIIKATGILKGQVELWLLGEWKSKKFGKECQSLEGWQYTRYLGFKKLEEVYGYMKQSDMGVVNFLPVPNHLTSIPNKSFEYMACSLPMVISNFPYWKEIFYRCALFADPKNPKEIAKKISILLNNENLRIKLGKAGRALVENKYSWESESIKLLNLYKELLK